LAGDRRDLIRQLFAEATAVLERAHAGASNGQSSKLDVAAYLQCANRVERAARDLLTLAVAPPILMVPGTDAAAEPDRTSSDAPT
jgi:hypothetical protein